jgi:phage-related holin
MIIQVNLLALFKALALAAFTAMLGFIVPVGHFLVVTFFLVVADLYTGTRAAKHRKEVIHSRGIRRTVEKITLYFIAIMIVHGVEKTFVNTTFNGSFVWTVAAIIAWSEIRSNLENIAQVTGIDIWSNLIKKIPSLSELVSRKKDEDEPNGK